MPTDPNARRDQKLEAILGAVNKGNKLLEAQTKILEKMEKNSRPTVITHHPYLERSEEVDPTPVVGTTPSSGA